MRNLIYLDNQATTPLAPEARDAMLPWLSGPESIGFANPHSAHRAGRAALVAVEVARDQVAALLPPGGRVIFTSGATEAINQAVASAPRGGIAFSAIEHSAVIESARGFRISNPLRHLRRSFSWFWYCGVAQIVEQGNHNPRVGGAGPSPATKRGQVVGR